MELKWYEEVFLLKDVAGLYKSSLPIIIILDEGYYGILEEECYSKDDMFFITEVREQYRVSVKNDGFESCHITIPLNSPLKFRYFEKDTPSDALTLLEVYNRGKLHCDVKISPDESMPMEFQQGIANDQLQTICLKNLTVTRVYQQPYLFGFPLPEVTKPFESTEVFPVHMEMRLKIAEGLQQGTKEEFVWLLRKLYDTSKNFKHGSNANGVQEIMMYTEDIEQEEENPYMYISPCDYIRTKDVVKWFESSGTSVYVGKKPTDLGPAGTLSRRPPPPPSSSEEDDKETANSDNKDSDSDADDYEVPQCQSATLPRVNKSPKPTTAPKPTSFRFPARKKETDQSDKAERKDKESKSAKAESRNKEKSEGTRSSGKNWLPKIMHWTKSKANDSEKSKSNTVQNNNEGMPNETVDTNIEGCSRSESQDTKITPDSDSSLSKQDYAGQSFAGISTVAPIVKPKPQAAVRKMMHGSAASNANPSNITDSGYSDVKSTAIVRPMPTSEPNQQITKEADKSQSEERRMVKEEEKLVNQDEECEYASFSDIPKDITTLGVRQIAACLRKMNMDKYVDKFMEMQIDGELLLSIELEDLKNDLGMTKMEVAKLNMFAHKRWRPKLE